MCGTLMEVGSAETTLNGGSADPMPVCIGDAQINYFLKMLIHKNNQKKNYLFLDFLLLLIN